MTLCYHCNCIQCSRKWKWSIIVCFSHCIDTFMLLCCYIDSNKLFLSILCKNTISTFFVDITSKKACFFVLGEIRFYKSTVFWFHKVIVSGLLTLFSNFFIISFFDHLIRKQLSVETATVVAAVVSDNGKLSLVF